MPSCRLHQHNKLFNAFHMHTFQSQTFRIVSKGHKCLCQEYFAMHSSHSSCHSSKCGWLYHNILPNQIHTFASLTFSNRLRARTTMSLSTVPTKGFSPPWYAAWARCRNIHGSVSASVWLQGSSVFIAIFYNPFVSTIPGQSFIYAGEKLPFISYIFQI